MQQEAQTSDLPASRKGRLLSWLGWLLIVYLVVVSLVAFVLPDFVRNVLQEKLSPPPFITKIQHIGINPLTLAVQVEGYSLGEQDGSKLLDFDQLRIDMSIASAWRRAIALDEAALVKPQVVARLDKQQQLNWQRYIDALSASFASDEPAAPAVDADTDADDTLPRLLISKLLVDDIGLKFIDQSKRDTFAADFGPTDIEVNDLSTLLGDQATYAVTASTPRAELIAWNGSVHINPLRSAGSISVSGWRVPVMWEYFKEQLNFELVEGRAGLSGSYNYDGNFVFNEGTFTLDDILITGRAADKTPLLGLPALRVSGIDFDLDRQRADIAQIDVQDLVVNERIDANGESLLAVSLTPIDSATATTTPASPAQAASVKTPPAASSAASSAPSSTTTAQTPSPVDAQQAVQATAAAVDETGGELAAVETTDAVDDPGGQPGPADADAGAGAGAGSVAAVPARAGNAGEFSLGLGDFTLANATVNVDHQLSATAVNRIKLQDIALVVQGFEYPAGDIQGFALDSRINQAGKIALQGSGDIDPLKADFKLQLADFALADLMPYIAPILSVKLESGALGAQLSGSVAQVGEVFNSAVGGKVQVGNLLVNDTAKKARIVSFNALNLNQLAWDSAQPSLQIEQVELQELFAKVVIFKDGSTNLSRLVVAPAAADDEANAVAQGGGPIPASGTAAGETQPAAPLAIDIKTVDFHDGKADFADLSLPRPFRAAIHDINGDIKGLSSSASAAAVVDITGAVDKYAPVTLKGKVKPLSEKLLVDLDLNFRNLELTSVSPYSDTYAGYNIDKGKLNADFKYFIDGTKLEAQNNLIIDQLTLGERTDSPEATSLPVALAIALLKDKNGVIDLNLPITGDIDDPEFRYGALVGKALLNLVTKIVTAPFALLGSLVGGGEDMDLVPFAAGKSEFSAAEASQLNKLSDALAERPQLSLSVRGVAVPAVDGPALQEASLAATLQEQGISVPVPAGDWKKVFNLYQESTGQKVSALEDELVAAQPMEKAQLQEAVQERVWQSLLDKQPAGEAELAQLARDRSEIVRETLVAAGVDAGRLFILDPEVDTTANAKPHGKLELDAK